ncbi:MAG: hypothetical protein ACLUFH_03330 [Monoglobales bacterium]
MMLIMLESVFMCFVILLVCVVGIRNGAGKFVAFYEKDVQKRVVELGYTTEKAIKKSTIIAGLALYLPMLIAVPLMVYYINGARGYWEIFGQITAVYIISCVFDRIFIDWYWVGKTKAWLIEGTEDLMPYIPLKTQLVKWTATLVIHPILAAIIAWIMTF